MSEKQQQVFKKHIEHRSKIIQERDNLWTELTFACEKDPDLIELQIKNECGGQIIIIGLLSKMIRDKLFYYIKRNYSNLSLIKITNQKNDFWKIKIGGYWSL